MSDTTARIYDNVLELIGNTPVVRINRAKGGLRCELLAKLEYLNPTGSLKDRIALQMIDDGMKSGLIKPGHTIVEPTSGNTGIAMAMVGAIRGVNTIFTLPNKNSKEKEMIMTALGAKVIRTPDAAPRDSPENYINIAKRLEAEGKGTVHCLDQYENESNPIAHERAADEILRQCGGKLDMIVISTGTGGTLTGIARALKKHLPGLKVVAVDPAGSILHDDKAIKRPYDVEGIGKPFHPKVLDKSLVDEWQVTQDAESFQAARLLIREEGLLIGGSSGAVLCAAWRAAASLNENQRCLMLFADSVRNYLTKYINDDWLEERGHSPQKKRKTNLF